MSSTLWTIALLTASISPSFHGFVATPTPASSTSRRSAHNFRQSGAKCTSHVAPNVAPTSRQRLPGHASSLQQNAGRKSFRHHSVGEDVGVSAATQGSATASNVWAEERFPGCSTVVSQVRASLRAAYWGAAVGQGWHVAFGSCDSVYPPDAKLVGARPWLA